MMTSNISGIVIFIDISCLTADSEPEKNGNSCSRPFTVICAATGKTYILNTAFYNLNIIIVLRHIIPHSTYSAYDLNH